MSFSRKLLQAQFALASGQFQEGGNAASISGLRMTADIEVVGGGVSSGIMSLSIYGMPLQIMNQLSTFGTQTDQRGNNKIQLFSGDSSDGQNIDSPILVYSGMIFNAFVDAQNQPDVCFRIITVPGGGVWAVAPALPISKPGPQDISAMMSNLAGQMGLTFENNGVSVKLSNPYYSGSPWTQAVRLAQHANVDMVVDRGILAISPRGKPRSGDAVLISPETGMVGYPAFRENSIIVKSIFNPAVKVGGQIQVESSLTPANGTWIVNRMVLDLECLMPHGRWFQTIEATPSGGE